MSRRRIEQFLPAVSVLGFLILWQVGVTVFDVKEFVLPRPSQIAAAMVSDAGELSSHFWVTFRILCAGYAAGVGLGIALAVAMTLLPLFRAAIYPLIVASQTIPKIAIAPLLILWFGVDALPKILIIAMLAFFPVLINTLNGLENSEDGHLELMRSVDAGFWEVYRHVRLPAAIPSVFAGLKLALTVSVIGAIVGEWVAGNEGLGYLLIAYNASLQTSRLFAALVVIVAMSAGCFLLISWIEEKVSWKARFEQDARSLSAGDA